MCYLLTYPELDQSPSQWVERQALQNGESIAHRLRRLRSEDMMLAGISVPPPDDNSKTSSAHPQAQSNNAAPYSPYPFTLLRFTVQRVNSTVQVSLRNIRARQCAFSCYKKAYKWVTKIFEIIL